MWRTSLLSCLAICLVLLAVMVFSTRRFTAAEEEAIDGELPSARQLVAKAIASLDADKEGGSHYWERGAIARAYLYLSDTAAAQRALLPYENDIWVPISYLSCAELQIELTGDQTVIPAALWQDNADMANLSLAEAFAKRGDIAKLFEHLEKIPKNSQSPLCGLGSRLVRILESAGQTEACRRVLVQWSDSLVTANSLFEFKQAKVDKLVSWLVKYGESERAKDLCNKWNRFLLSVTNVEENGATLAIVWAMLGRSLATCGEHDSAREALTKAGQFMEAAKALKLDREMPIRSFDFASDCAALAARQLDILGTNVAAGKYQQAYDLANAIVPKYDYYGFEKIIQVQLEADDVRAARQTIERVLTSRYRARCWDKITGYYLENGLGDDAREAARLAASELDRDGFESFMAEDVARVAASVEAAGETELAHRLFERAIALSESDETSPKSYYPWIARMQVSAGYLADAYKTIQGIRDSGSRAQPLAELALAVAKAEYAAKNKKAGETH